MNESPGMIQQDDGTWLCLERGCDFTGTARQVAGHRRAHSVKPWTKVRRPGTGRIRRTLSEKSGVYYRAELPRHLTSGSAVGKNFVNYRAAEAWLDRKVEEMERAVATSTRLNAEPTHHALNSSPGRNAAQEVPSPDRQGIDSMRDGITEARNAFAEYHSANTFHLGLSQSGIIAAALLALIASESTTPEERRRAAQAYAELVTATSHLTDRRSQR